MVQLALKKANSTEKRGRKAWSLNRVRYDRPAAKDVSVFAVGFLFSGKGELMDGTSRGRCSAIGHDHN
jgi:hypothetical protein